jgi:gliding motility-associated-like protein
VKPILAFFLLTCSTILGQAQGTWTWIHGDTAYPYLNLSPNTLLSHPIRGTKGVASPINTPGGVAAAEGANWKSPDGRFWLLDNNITNPDSFPQIWSYDYKTNQWTWEAGYDTLVIEGACPADFVQDVQKQYIYEAGSPSWSDSLGNLWMYARLYSSFARSRYVLYKFDIQTKKITIIDCRSSNTKIKGTRGVASSLNWPGYRNESATWRVGNRLLLMGNGLYSIPDNELWEYNIGTGLWTWLGGSAGSEPTYNHGVKGVASASNWPKASILTTSKWVSGTKIYMFSGLSLRGASMPPSSSILWEYDLTNGLWTWLSGDSASIASNKGRYPSVTCLDSPDLIPRGRHSGLSPQTSICNNAFWLYSTRAPGNVSSLVDSSFHADLWLYRPSINRWICLDKGENVKAYSYGTKGVPSPSNRPPTRLYTMMWTDDQDRLYLFGASLYNIQDTEVDGTLAFRRFGNDLWRYDPDYSCINTSLSEKFIDRNIQYRICSGDSTVVRVRLGYDSLKVSPMTGVRIVTTSTGAMVWLKPNVSRNYKITAYGYRCESLLDSLTVPITIFPPRTSTEIISICFGQTYKGKSTTGLHTITYPSPGGCDSTVFLYLTVRPPQTKTMDTTICEGASVLGRSSTGVFLDTLLATNGCDSIRTLRLTVIPRQLLIDTSICRGSAFAGYSIAGTYLDTLTSSQGCITYRTIIIRILEHSTSTHTMSICAGGSYWGHRGTGTYRDILLASNGCDSVRTLHLTELPPSGSTLDTSICQGSSIRGHSISGNYRDTLTDRNGCDSICVLRLTVRAARPIKPLRNIGICPGSDTIIDAGIGHRAYLWSAGETTSQIRIAAAQRYILQFVDSTGCQGRDSMTLSHFNPPQIKMPDTLQNYKGEYFFLEPIISPPASSKSRYQWIPNGVFTCDTCRQVEFRPDTHRIVTLLYTDERGCTASASSQILVYGKWAVGYPSAFSPNGDDQNDTYAPNTTNIKSYTLEIYNRLGEKVYQYRPERPSWDGTFKGEPAPMSTYYYYSEVILLNKAIYLYKGVFHLIR